MSLASDRRTLQQPVQHLVANLDKAESKIERDLPPPSLVENIIEARRLQPAAVGTARVSEEGVEGVNPTAEELQGVPTLLPPQTASFMLQSPEQENAWRTTVAIPGSKKTFMNHHQAPTEVTAVMVIDKQSIPSEETPSHHGAAQQCAHITGWNTLAGEVEPVRSGHVPDARGAISFQRKEAPPQQGLGTDAEMMHGKTCGAGTPSDVSHQRRLTSPPSHDHDNRATKTKKSVGMYPRSKNNAAIDTSRPCAPSEKGSQAAGDATLVAGDKMGVRDEISARISEIGYRSVLRADAKEKVCMKIEGGVENIVGCFGAAFKSYPSVRFKICPQKNSHPHSTNRGAIVVVLV